MDGVDDLGGLLDELVASHRFHGQLLNLGDGRLFRLSGRTAPVAVEHTAWLNTIQLK